MKIPSTVLCLTSSTLLFSLQTTGLAQANSWTNSVSGNWQDPYWSLGFLPETNQEILLTNAGWKALAIDPNTAQNFPQTMTVNSITISSPSNSFNTLLLNYSGTQSPLTVQSVSIGTNSAITMLSSALLLDGPPGTTMQVGGEVNQNDSVVSGRQINVGYIGPGPYNFNSGIVAVSNIWVGSTFNGVFNQAGGTNTTGITDVQGGEYVLEDGYFASTIYFNNSGVFRQEGGVLNSPLTIYDGNYFLDGGVHNGSVLAPSSNGSSTGIATIVQTGGTNAGDLNIGTQGDSGSGHYIISNGVVSGAITVGGIGSLVQWGGSLVAGTLNVQGEDVNLKGGGGETLTGTYALSQGTVSSSNFYLSGAYTQSGGTNLVSGQLYIAGAPCSLLQTGGLLCASNLYLNAAEPWNGASFGGAVFITNELTEAGYPGYCVSSGNLTVSNISLLYSVFTLSGGSVNQSGTLTMNAAVLSCTAQGSYHLGPVQLSSAASTASGILLGSHPCILQFTDTSAMTWSNAPFLQITNWSGSINGGGSQQIIFGSNSAALTPRQLSQIQFQNPAGLAPGTYPAQILPTTGEIVPMLPLKLQIGGSTSNGAISLQVQGEIGQNYEVDVSTDLVVWSYWTTVSNSTGTISLSDSEANNFPQRFYRVRVLP